jgi:hypothetical protein
MVDKKNYDELERIMNRLGDSVLELSDESILAEIRATGADPQEKAERTRFTLRQSSKALKAVNKRLWNLGHSLNPKGWWHEERGYSNSCRDCGLSVSFTTATNEIWGNALIGPCRESAQLTIRKREASRK